MAPLNPSSFATYHSLHSQPTAPTSTSTQSTNCKFPHEKPRPTIHEPGSAPATPGKPVTRDNTTSLNRAELSISERVSRKKNPRRQCKLFNGLSSEVGKNEGIITRLRTSLKQFEQPLARRSTLTNVKGLEPVPRARALEANHPANEKEAGVLLLRLAKCTRVPGIRLTTSGTDNDMGDVE
ncbi:hypothetical protein MPH_01857 [Macrophomina phaseolina MS6]|uniref:Uncharacterized protein n=1 Tax=Macrophomina phaseolina (strain MS6) TaxID=1126212 RepID=K2S1C8_MACPH|nr:hypothetical protein MPH_01857 [Macrophomina phaseolina MS6]